MFLNIIPFRFNLNNQPNDLDRLLMLFNDKLKVQSHKQLPYDYIKSFSKHELYYCVFDFVHLHLLSERVSNIKSTDGYERTHIPFTLTVAQKGYDAFALNVSAHGDYISRSFLEQFILYYKKCLNKTTSLVQREKALKSSVLLR